MAVILMYRVDIGFDSERGYAAALCADPGLKTQRIKGIKASNIRQLCRKVHESICEDEQKRRRFPLESEAQSVPQIITPENGDPLFKQV